MNTLKIISLGVLLASVAPLAGYVWALGPEPEGSITLSEKADGGGDQCTLPFKTDYYNMQYHGCKNDQMSYFRLNGVPSAATIEFNSEKDCYRGDWRYTVRTYIEKTTTRFISIPDELQHALVGDIIVKGVRMEGSYYHHGNVKGKLSCIWIEKSDIVNP